VAGLELLCRQRTHVAHGRESMIVRWRLSRKWTTAPHLQHLVTKESRKDPSSGKMFTSLLVKWWRVSA
jgi:hypothetical protein